MRTSLSLAALFATLAVGAIAQAQQPINPYGTADVAGPASDPPQVVDLYANPYEGYPPPPAYDYQPPSAGPGPSYAPPSYQRGYYLYPTGQQQYPVYYAPPAGGCCCDPCAQYHQQPQVQYPYPYQYSYPPTTSLYKPKPTERIRRFSLGVHGTVLGLNNAIGKNDMTLGGAGIQLRIRSKGRFGLELNQSFLGGDAFNGAVQRTTFPFQFSLMLYILPNNDDRHFNIYGLVGFGVQADTLKVRDENGNFASQDFIEGEGHVGLGAELRWKWFALAADVRALGFLRDNSSAPASYYVGQTNAIVAERGWGMSGNVYVNLWF